MASKDGATQEPTTMLCKACAEEIPANAKRCKHCGSYQGIRRHLDTLNFSMALGIAFLSLLVLLSKEIILPTVSEFFSGRSFGMNSNVVRLSEDEIEVIFENNGNETVWIRQGALCTIWDYPDPDKHIEQLINLTNDELYKSDKIEGRYILSFHPKNDASVVQIAPGQSIMLNTPLSAVRRSDDVLSDEQGLRDISYCSLSFTLADGRKTGDFVAVNNLDAFSTLKALHAEEIPSF